MKRLSLPVLPAIMIAGGISPVDALEIGQIDVQSNLGQPLRASIAYALAPNEAIADYCVTLAPLNRLNGLPVVSGANVSIANGVITVNGSGAVSEPLIAARLEVNCPYSSKVSREFMLFVDPAGPPVDSVVAAAPAAGSAPRAQAQRPPLVAPASKPPIAMGTSYRVEPGDSAYDIAARLEDRGTPVWQAVEAILEANPGSFLDGDPNRLKAGTVLQIPGAVAPGEANQEFQTVDQNPVASIPETVDNATPVPLSTPEIVDDTAYLAPAAVPGTVVSEPQVREPGGMTVDISADPENPFAGVDNAIVDPSVTLESAAAAPPTVAPAAQPDIATPTATMPAKPKPDILPVATAANNGGSHVIWLALGGTLAVIGSLFFWRRRKTAEANAVMAAVAARRPQPERHLEEDSIEVQVIDSPEAAAALDYDLSDDSPTEENLALDADLFAGDGLVDANSAEQVDFAIAPTTKLDLELTEADAREPEESETDIMPAPERSAGSILESEVLPEEDDYDMSVIMDVTKIRMPEEATERDFKAVVVDDFADDSLVEDDPYTLSQEVDYQILEQEYEDEITATQAVNMEIERAARELANDLDESVIIESDTLSSEETAALPIAKIAELEATASVPVGFDVDPAQIDTGLNDDITVNFNLGDSDDGRDDQTVEVYIQSTKADSRAG